jgi:hypothetical protein
LSEEILQPNECPRCKARAIIEVGLEEWGAYEVLECLCMECGLIFLVAPTNVIYGVKKRDEEDDQDK